MPELICIPSNLPGGIDAKVAPAFEQAEVYNFLQVSTNEGQDQIKFISMRYSCDGLACVDPIDAISGRKAVVLVVKGINPGLMIRFLEKGIQISLIPDDISVLSTAKAYLLGILKEITRAEFPKRKEINGK